MSVCPAGHHLYFPIEFGLDLYTKFDFLNRKYEKKIQSVCIYVFFNFFINVIKKFLIKKGFFKVSWKRTYKKP